MIISTLLRIVRRRNPYAPQPPELSRKHNPDLYAAIAKVCERSGDSSEHFKLPDMRDLAADRDVKRLQRDHNSR